MKISVLCGLLLAIAAGPACADHESVFAPIPGGSVIPVRNDAIQLKSEIIEIWIQDSDRDSARLYANPNRVKVTYTFVNKTNRPQTVVMGFPNHSQTNLGLLVPLTEFTFSENGIPLEVFERGNGTKEDPHSDYDVYECSSVLFSPGEIKRLIASYNDSCGPGDFEYVLKTGSSWQGRIEKINVIIHPVFSRYDRLFYTPWTAYTLTDDLRLVTGTAGGVTVSPPRGHWKGDTYYMEFNNLEPDFNIKVSINPTLLDRATTDQRLFRREDSVTGQDWLIGETGLVWSGGRSFVLVKRIGLAGDPRSAAPLPKSARVHFSALPGRETINSTLKPEAAMQIIEMKRPVFCCSIDLEFLESHGAGESTRHQPLNFRHFTFETIEKADYLRRGGILSRAAAVHEAPNPYSPKLSSVTKGQTVALIDMTFSKMTVGAESDFWFRIKTADGRTGWVFGGSLDVR
jgi:hypothetical protein